jgi:hypothetical protein
VFANADVYTEDRATIANAGEVAATGPETSIVYVPAPTASKSSGYTCLNVLLHPPRSLPTLPENTVAPPERTANVAPVSASVDMRYARLDPSAG